MKVRIFCVQIISIIILISLPCINFAITKSSIVAMNQLIQEIKQHKISPEEAHKRAKVLMQSGALLPDDKDALTDLAQKELHMPNIIESSSTTSKVSSIKKDPKQAVEIPIPTPQPFATQTLFVFLDDSEINSVKNNFGKILGAITPDFASAIAQEAGPIVVSASLVANMRKPQDPETRTPQQLLKRYQEIRTKNGPQVSPDESTKQLEDESHILRLVAGLDDNIFKKWVIKEISPLLYLFLPKKYLQEKKIQDTDVEKVSGQVGFTTTEQALGLKVNHMKHISSLNAIKKPDSAPEFTTYFVELLPAIFVTNLEYTTHNKGGIRPVWALYMDGHGDINRFICGLPFEQFRNCLEFFEKKIMTKLLFYTSCHASGVNAELVYRDNKNALFKTYSFAIIAQALTDTVTIAPELELELVRGVLQLKTSHDYIDFAKNIAAADTIGYRALMEPFIPKIQEVGLGYFPQIKFPGIPWFSVLDSDKVVAIGSIMGKTRTEPLNVARFFAKGSAPADPLGVLFYTQDIPFELVIDTKVTPHFVSMIAGNAIHRIQKISSTYHTSDEILNNFYLKGLTPQKIFLIQEIDAPLSKEMQDLLGVTRTTLQNVIMHSTEQYGGTTMTAYYPYGDSLYWTQKLSPEDKNPLELAVLPQRDEYEQLLALADKKEKIALIPASKSNIQTEAHAVFAKKMVGFEIAAAIHNIVSKLPQNYALRIPKIQALCSTDDVQCSLNILKTISQYGAFSGHKILWFDELEECRMPGEECYTQYTDVIVDISTKETQILYKDTHEAMFYMLTSEQFELSKDYVPKYEELFAYFAKNGRLSEKLEKELESIDIRSVHKQLTPEAITKIKQVQEKKATNPAQKQN